MTLEDLKHIFRFQTTATEDYVPTGKLNYELIESQNKVTASVPAEHIENLVSLLDNFVFDAYRDKIPVFIKPESEL
jgi:hypothetical protein